jgi:hypothetical protein
MEHDHRNKRGNPHRIDAIEASCRRALGGRQRGDRSVGTAHQDLHPAAKLPKSVMGQSSMQGGRARALYSGQAWLS